MKYGPSSDSSGRAAPGAFVTRIALVALAALAGACSSGTPNNGGGGPVDAGADVEDDVKVFLGPGDLTVTWTVNGMPAAQGCAMAQATSVELSTPDFSGTPVTVPCTAGRHEFNQVMATNQQITTRLLGANNTRIYDYVLQVLVRTNMRTTHNIDFSPPGRARIRWTVNGAPASEGCTAVIADVVQAQRTQRVVGSGACSAGALTLTGTFQPGPLTVNMLLANSNERQALDSQAATVMVPTGATGEATVDFRANPRMMR